MGLRTRMLRVRPREAWIRSGCRVARVAALAVIGMLSIATAGFCEDDAVSRELTAFPYPSTADGGVTSRELTAYVGGGPAQPDAVSRELTAYVGGGPTQPDAVSRELTAYVGGGPTQPDAVSRELTVYPDTLLAGIADAMSREWTVFPDPTGGLQVDALGREISLWYHLDWSAVSDQPAPGRFEMARPSPNPTAGNPQLRLGLPAEAQVSLEWFDVSGRCVSRMRSEKPLPPGWYDLATDTARWGRGLYFYRLQAGPEVWKGRVVVMR